MLITLGLNIILIMLGIFWTKYAVCIGKDRIPGEKYYLIICTIVLAFLSAARGDFYVDYKGYEQIYERFASYSFREIIQFGYFSNPETGYLVFQHLIRVLTDNVIYIFIVSSIIVVSSNIYVLKNNPELMLVIFLFVTGGMYFPSFNLLRQCLAISFVLFATRWLYERKFIRYMVVIFFASTFHISALIMLPFYFLSRVHIKKKYFGILLSGLAGIIILQPVITEYITQYFYTWYDWDMVEGFSWKNLLSPMLISLVSMGLYLLNTKNDDDDIINVENIQLIAVFFYLGFSVMGLFNVYLQRMSHYFSTYTIAFLGSQVSNYKNRKLILVGLILFYLLFSLITSFDTPYYFIWER